MDPSQSPLRTISWEVSITCYYTQQRHAILCMKHLRSLEATYIGSGCDQYVHLNESIFEWEEGETYWRNGSFHVLNIIWRKINKDKPEKYWMWRCQWTDWLPSESTMMLCISKVSFLVFRSVWWSAEIQNKAGPRSLYCAKPLKFYKILKKKILLLQENASL